MKASRRLTGMTLIELLATIAILGFLTTFSLPTLRGLQARQSINSAERGIQSMLYGLQQLALAPPAADETNYKVIGYGIGIHKKGAPYTFGGNCYYLATNDFLMTYTYFIAKSDSNGVIQVAPSEFDPTQCDSSPGPHPLKKSSKYVYLLPKNVSIYDTKSVNDSTPATNLPWFISVPYQATGSQYGDLPLPNYYQNPIPDGVSGAKATLVLQHNSVKVGENKLCHAVQLFRESNGVNITTKSIKPCT